MKNDEAFIRRKRMTRREALGLLGVAGVAGLGVIAGCSSDDSTSATQTATPASSKTQPATASAAPSATAAATATPAPTSAAAINCVVRPSVTEGPYFVDEMLNRSDIRSDPTSGAISEGVPLQITIRVYDVTQSCSPLSGGHVDMWHCDANGLYSDEAQNGTSGQKFLRGYQATDANGIANFTTIYPGWYQGRAVHIHFKVRTYDGSSQTYEFTSQLFFDDTLSDQVYQQTPYNTRGTRNTRNANDMVYTGRADNGIASSNAGDMLLIALTPNNGGYAGTFDVGLDMS